MVNCNYLKWNCLRYLYINIHGSALCLVLKIRFTDNRTMSYTLPLVWLFARGALPRELKVWHVSSADQRRWGITARLYLHLQCCKIFTFTLLICWHITHIHTLAYHMGPPSISHGSTWVPDMSSGNNSNTMKNCKKKTIQTKQLCLLCLFNTCICDLVLGMNL